MKVGIDISQIIYETGVSHYTLNLVSNLLKIQKNEEYIFFGGSLRRLQDLKEITSGLEGRFKLRLFPFPPTAAGFVWNVLHILPVEALIGKVDVFHSTDWSQPPSRAFKVTTVHDLAPVLFPKLSHPRIVRTHHKRLKWVQKEVDRVIVPSLATKKDLIEYGVDEKKIRLVPEAVADDFTRVDDQEVSRIKAKYGIEGNYLLSIGVGERKNTQRTIKAFLSLNSGLKLVLIGRNTGEYRKNPNIIFTGHVASNELRAFYSGAQGLVYPSIYEGFGLPILEAFACDCPVLTSNLSSLPEVAGDAAILVDPNSTDSVLSGMKELLKSSRVLTKKGRNRLKYYSWQRTAAETLKIYKEYN